MKYLMLIAALGLSACTSIPYSERDTNWRERHQRVEFREPIYQRNWRTGRYQLMCQRPFDVLVRYRGRIVCTDRF